MLTWRPVPLKRETSRLIWIADMENREIYAHLAPVPLKREKSMLIWIADMKNREIYAHLALCH